jgi:hypothetical protein
MICIHTSNRLLIIYLYMYKGFGFQVGGIRLFIHIYLSVLCIQLHILWFNINLTLEVENAIILI